MPDELELVRAHRAPTTPADPEAREHAWAAVLAAQARAGRGAAPDHASDPPAGPLRWRRRTAPRRAAHDARTGRRPRRSWARPAGVAAGLAVAAAATAALVLPSGDGGLRPLGAAPASAAEALGRAAQAAAGNGTPALGPGQVLYVRERSAYLATFGDPPPFSTRTPRVRTTWAARDGSGRYVERTAGRPEFPGPRDRERWKAAGRPELGSPAPDSLAMRPHRFDFGAHGLSLRELEALPTEPRALHAALVAAAGDAGSSREQEAFVIVGDLLRSAPVPPRLRAALYRATALIDGVRLVGAVRDPLGRPGLAVELTDGDLLHQLVFDPETSALLAEQDALVHRVDYVDGAPGAVVSSRVLEREAVVDAVGDEP